MLSVRARNVVINLLGADSAKLSDDELAKMLAQFSERELRRTRGMGQRSFEQIQGLVKAYGHQLREPNRRPATY
jgi:hypothetical protein